MEKTFIINENKLYSVYGLKLNNDKKEKFKREYVKAYIKLLSERRQ